MLGALFGGGFLRVLLLNLGTALGTTGLIKIADDYIMPFFNQEEHSPRREWLMMLSGGLLVLLAVKVLK